MKRVIYLTGPPGTGKTTLAGGLSDQFDAEVVSYGSLLTQTHAVADQEELRARSSQVITTDSVVDADAAMRGLIGASSKNVFVIDSHAVTRERFGFRAIPYDLATVQMLGLTDIVCLYAPPEVILRRHESDRAGRQTSDAFELSMHTNLQSSVALMYSHTAGIPVYFIDASISAPDVLARVIDACGLSGA